MLRNVIGLLAAAAPEELVGDRPPIGQGNHPERWILLGALATVALLLFVWAYFVRKPKPTEPRARLLVEKAARSERDDAQRRRRRRRPDHPDNLPRNPTLSETGGLPPLRDDPPDSSDPPPTTPING